jgi:CRP-like cAMP-binding protein
MYEVLKSHIAKYVQLTEEEFERATRLFIPKKIRKRGFLLQEGDVCKHIAFVTKGCLRSYSVDEKGVEHVLQFAVEEWWISDLYSFLTGEPATSYIDALEDSELLLIDNPSFEKLQTELPKFERFFRLLLQNAYIATQRRINASLSLSAEKRYLELIGSCPTISQRVPQRHIASFLGVTPEALSRIRKRLFDKPRT